MGERGSPRIIEAEPINSQQISPNSRVHGDDLPPPIPKRRGEIVERTKRVNKFQIQKNTTCTFIIQHIKGIRHRAFRHRWSELMWEAIPDGISLIFVGYPPPPSRIQPHTLAYTRMTFFASFSCVNKRSPLAPKREPWRPINLQKNAKNEDRDGVRTQLQK